VGSNPLVNLLNKSFKKGAKMINVILMLLSMFLMACGVGFLWLFILIYRYEKQLEKNKIPRCPFCEGFGVPKEYHGALQTILRKMGAGGYG